MEKKPIDTSKDLYNSYDAFQADPIPDNFVRFCKALSNTAMLMPRPVEGKGPAILSTQNKENYLPAFTAKTEMNKWVFTKNDISIAPFSLLSSIVTDELRLNGIVIDPFGKQIILKREQLQEILNATKQMTVNRIDHSGKLLFEKAASIPPQLSKALAQGLSHKSNVYEAYILFARDENEATHHLFFLIDFDGDRKLMFPYIADIIISRT